MKVLASFTYALRGATLLIVAALLAGCAGGGTSRGVVQLGPTGASGNRAAANDTGDLESGLRVMQYNVNEGSDFLQVQGTTTTSQFLVGVGQVITQVQSTNPPERMQAVAKQIIARRPDLVSLEELDQWYTGSFNPTTSQCGSMTLEYDMVQELLAALAAQGGHYQMVVQAQQYAFPPTPGLIPPSTFLCAQVVNHLAILARTDVDPRELRISNPQSAQYVNERILQTPVGALPEPRAWVAVDGVFRGKAFRFIGTHLESVDASIRELQGGELRAGPANVKVPVILAMDSNAQAAPPPQDPTYVDFINAGYADAWSEIFPSRPGLTCCQAESDNNPVSQLSQRIDLILTKGSVEAQRIALFNDDPLSRLPDGLWPSDHAGVAASLELDQ
jgi:hypothetical protein